MSTNESTIKIVQVPNPYLDHYQQMTKDFGDDSIGLFGIREKAVRRFAWAAPNRAAIEAITDLGPVVEIGAGAGYWAALIAGHGADVVAYDAKPPSTEVNTYVEGTGVFFDVFAGGPERAGEYPDRALMLCWPPMTPFAEAALRAYEGDTVVYVGEGWGGCCATDEFFDELDRSWTRTRTVAIPTWPGIHDTLSVWTR